MVPSLSTSLILAVASLFAVLLWAQHVVSVEVARKDEGADFGGANGALAARTETALAITTNNKAMKTHIDMRQLESSVQPQQVIRVGKDRPASRLVGSISQAEGSRWCKGRPTFWLVGHNKVSG